MGRMSTETLDIGHLNSYNQLSVNESSQNSGCGFAKRIQMCSGTEVWISDFLLYYVTWGGDSSDGGGGGGEHDYKQAAAQGMPPRQISESDVLKSLLRPFLTTT